MFVLVFLRNYAFFGDNDYVATKTLQIVAYVLVSSAACSASLSLY